MGVDGSGVSAWNRDSNEVLGHNTGPFLFM